MVGIRSNYCISENQCAHAVNLQLLLITSDEINTQLLLGCHLTLSEEWVHAKMLAMLGSLEKSATSSGVKVGPAGRVLTCGSGDGTSPH